MNFLLKRKICKLVISKNDPHTFLVAKHEIDLTNKSQGSRLFVGPTREADAKFADADLSTKLKLLGVDVASFGGSSDFWFKRQYSSTGWGPFGVVGVFS